VPTRGLVEHHTVGEAPDHLGRLGVGIGHGWSIGHPDRAG
jgi:hypothetical protein